MMEIISDIIFSFFALFYSPIFLKKLSQAEDPKRLWQERQGEIDLKGLPKDKPRIWLHAVSVGEVKAIETFYQMLEKKGYQVLLSTVTPTGQKEAKKVAGCKTFYYPFDWTFAVKKALDIVEPDMILLAETEIWPNFILEASRRGIPIGVVNGRLSKRSLERYLWVDFWMKKLLPRLNFFLMQTPKDADRIRELGAPPERVSVLGNMKFDTPRESALSSPQVLKLKFKIPATKRVWVVGSTHPGEEEKVLSVFTRLRSLFHNLVLIIAPRHIERGAPVEAAARGFNFKTVRMTELEKFRGEYDCLILDTIGDLKKVYSFADIVWMGGSFVPHGGQNPIEPALFSKPILTGPHVANFEFVYEELEKNRSVVIVPTQDELFVRIKEFLESPDKSEDYGRRARETVERLSGASQKTAEKIESLLTKNIA